MFDPDKIQLSPKELADAVLSKIDIPEEQKGFQLITGTSADISQVKELDDLAFGQHHGISEAELQEIINNGFVILLKDPEGNLIGEAQLITKQTPDLKYQLADNEAYAYGTAIHPETQGKGLGQLTGKAQRLLAKEAGKEVVVLTVRAENVASLKSRFKQGFKITNFDPEYYGKIEDGGSRVIMKGNVDQDQTSEKELLELVKSNSIPTFSGQNFNEDLLAVPVTFGNEVDMSANQQIDALIKTGYKGVWVFKNGEISEEGDNSRGLFIFKKE